MLEIARGISEQKAKVYEKLHIPTKDEIMDEIIAIGKGIAEGRTHSSGYDDVIALFVETFNGDLEFQGFIGDIPGLIDTDGNLLHVGDLVEMNYQGDPSYKQYVTKILPKQKTIELSNAKLVRSYQRISPNKRKPKSIFHFVSCIEEYYKFINHQSEESKKQE